MSLETYTTVSFPIQLAGVKVDELFDVNEHGTVTHVRGLIPKRPERNLFFPEQKVLIEGVQKLRGGAPVFCPLFGTVPADNPHYEGIDLQQHGLVRKNSCIQKVVDSKGKITTSFQFDTPWKHSVNVSGYIPEAHQFVHELQVKYCAGENTAQPVMPLSAAFQPYIATHDKSFRIYYGDSFSITSLQIVRGESLFIRGTGNPKDALQLVFSDYQVEFYIQGMYQHFCIWTDNIVGYICIKPFFGKHFSGPHLLKNECECSGRCIMNVT